MSQTRAAAPDWGELLALEQREGSDRALLETLLEGARLELAVPWAAAYAEADRGFERVALAGPGPAPVRLLEAETKAPRAGFRIERLASGLLVVPPETSEVRPGPFTVLLAGALRCHRLKGQLKQHRFQVNYRVVETEALYEVGLAIASTLEMDELADVVLLRAVSLLDARRGALYLVDGGRAVLKGTIGGSAREQWPLADAAARAVLAGTGEPPADVLPGATHILAVPISIDEQPRGLLLVADKESRAGVGPFAASDRRTLSLFANQAAIALENARLHQQAIEKERLEREMVLAADIQRRLLPKRLPETPGYEVFGWNRSARQIGGDYFDFLPRGDDGLGLVIADVSGKGMPAALLVSTLHSALRLLMDRFDVGPDFLARLNQHILDSSAPNKFITLFLGELDLPSGALRYLNAGHNPALLAHPDGGIEPLRPGGLPLGLLPHSTFHTEEARLRSGDLLCLYSDGITECLSPQDEEFGMDRLGALLRTRRTEPLEAVVRAIDEETTAFADGLPQGDDQTVVLVRRI